MQFILDLVHAKDGCVVMLAAGLPFLLLQHAVGHHLLGCLVDDRRQVDLLPLGFFFEDRKFLHDLIILMSFLDEVVSIGPK